MEEQWKPVPDYEGYYEVSDQGRVRSLDRLVLQKNPYTDKARRVYKGKVLKLSQRTGGYLYARLSKVIDGTQRLKDFRVHRLVMMAFEPRDDHAQREVNHINNVRDDNRLSNLEWSDRSSNMKHAHKHGDAVSPLRLSKNRFYG